MSGNNLLDVVNWLRDEQIVCLHNSYRNNKIYGTKGTRIIYVDLKNWPDLLNEDEWPYYIKDAGFKEYEGNLPQNEEHYILPKRNP